MKMVLDCLSTLRTHFMLRYGRMDSTSPGWKLVGERVASANSTPKEERFRMLSSPPFGEDRRKLLPNSKSPHGLRSSPKTTGAVYLRASFLIWIMPLIYLVFMPCISRDHKSCRPQVSRSLSAQTRILHRSPCCKNLWNDEIEQLGCKSPSCSCYHISFRPILFLCDELKAVSVAECSNTVAVERCQWHIRWKCGDEEWSNTSCLWSKFHSNFYITSKLTEFLFMHIQRVACLLRKVVQEIERRICTQAEHLRTVMCLL